MRLWDLLAVAAVVGLLFGAKRLPGAARALGRSVHILRTESRPRPTRPDPDGHRVLHARRVPSDPAAR